MSAKRQEQTKRSFQIWRPVHYTEHVAEIDEHLLSRAVNLGRCRPLSPLSLVSECPIGTTQMT
jgi:hypothetical protein